MGNRLITTSNVGPITSQAKIDVADSSAVQLNLTAGKQFIKYVNTGGKVAWEGDNLVDPANKRGCPLYPNQGVYHDRPKSDFNVYFKCASGDSTTISIVEG